MKVSVVISITVMSLAFFSCKKGEDSSEKKKSSTPVLKKTNPSIKTDKKDSKSSKDKPLEIKKKTHPSPAKFVYKGEVSVSKKLKVTKGSRNLRIDDAGNFLSWGPEKGVETVYGTFNGKDKKLDVKYFHNAVFSSRAGTFAAFSGDTLYVESTGEMKKYFGKGCQTKCETEPCIRMCPIISDAKFSFNGKYLAYFSWFADAAGDYTQSLTVLDTTTWKVAALFDYSFEEGGSGSIGFSDDDSVLLVQITSGSTLFTDRISVSGVRDMVRLDSGKPWTSIAHEKMKLPCEDCIEFSGLSENWYFTAYEKDGKSRIYMKNMITGKKSTVSMNAIKDASVCAVTGTPEKVVVSHCILKEYELGNGRKRYVRRIQAVTSIEGDSTAVISSFGVFHHSFGGTGYISDDYLHFSEKSKIRDIKIGKCNVEDVTVSPLGRKIGVLCSDNNAVIIDVK
ncbi:MAG: hypothetical protein JXR95_01605 [Deltaproteobacteria bacterium]|nr:hypothetical protein [Deltaproteobacteria bacterium]